MYVIEIGVTVHDTAALYRAAVQRYLDGGGVGSETEALLGTADEPDVPSCVQMLYDPGESYLGTSIEYSEVEDASS